MTNPVKNKCKQCEQLAPKKSKFSALEAGELFEFANKERSFFGLCVKCGCAPGEFHRQGSSYYTPTDHCGANIQVIRESELIRLGRYRPLFPPTVPKAKGSAC